MFDKQKQAEEERRQKFLKSVENYKDWKVRVSLTIPQIFTICKTLCRAINLDTALKKQFYRIYDCDEEKQMCSAVLEKLLLTPRMSSSHLLRETHPNYNSSKWHGDVEDILYNCVSAELLNIDLNLSRFKIDKEQARNVVEELRR